MLNNLLIQAIFLYHNVLREVYPEPVEGSLCFGEKQGPNQFSLILSSQMILKKCNETL